MRSSTSVLASVAIITIGILGLLYMRLNGTPMPVETYITEALTIRDIAVNTAAPQVRTDQELPRRGQTDQELHVPPQGQTDKELPPQGQTDKELPHQGQADKELPPQGQTDHELPHQGQMDQEPLHKSSTRSTSVFPLSYTFHRDTDSEGTTTSGKTFIMDPSFSHRYSFLRSDFVRSSREIVREFVVVMGVSSSHYNEAQDAVASVQKNFPGKKLLYFDWGLTDEQRHHVSSWCYVELMPFNFSATIPFLAEVAIGEVWHYQMAKVYVIVEALRDHPAVMWMDSSIRLMTGQIKAVYKMAENNSGLVFFGHVSHSTYAVTPPGMYEYLPTSESAMKTASHVQTGAVFIVRSRQVCEQVLWWLMLCAYKKECVFSKEITSHCAFQKRYRHSFADRKKRSNKTDFNNCSRFDQSMLNLLVGNMFRFDARMYCVSGCRKTFIKIARRPTHLYDVKTCPHEAAGRNSPP